MEWDMAGSDIDTDRMAPIGTDSLVGLAMGDGVVPPSARAVNLSVLGAQHAHTVWTLEWLRNDGQNDIYRIRNNDMGLYLTMSEGDQIQSRVLGGVLATQQQLITTQEWKVTLWAPRSLQFISSNGFAMQTVNGAVNPGAAVWLEPADTQQGSNQIWQV
jgi:hypothetical protein